MNSPLQWAGGRGFGHSEAELRQMSSLRQRIGLPFHWALKGIEYFYHITNSISTGGSNLITLFQMLSGPGAFLLSKFMMINSTLTTSVVMVRSVEVVRHCSLLLCLPEGYG